jgi:hypothetical protein
MREYYIQLEGLMASYLLVIGSIISGLAVWALVKTLKLLVLGGRARGVIVRVDEQLRLGDSDRKKVCAAWRHGCSFA